MATINAEDDTFVVIVQYAVAPADIQALITDMAAQVEAWICRCPGFISASFHASEDGQRMVNYAQWRSRADWEAFMKRPEQRGLRDAITAADADMCDARGYSVVRSVYAD
ncbi:MAG TPA: antibiotic biosynthesis monooxygenase family protein [Acidisphaera sp.]|nr:antibiotic biosynthesis monooxygenase family protein [Acidisphaera sp.]